jgi:hypothetical protein
MILESAAVCPACKHHVRFEPGAQGAASATGHTPLSIEGSFRNPADDVAWEYSVVVTIRDDKGKEIARKLIGVGALRPDEQRSFSLSVEMAPGKSKNAPARPSLSRPVAPTPPKPGPPGSPMRGGGLRR